MRLTGEQAEQRLTAAWGRPAYVNRYRLAGNRASWTATDHNGHYLSLAQGWDSDGRTVFWPSGGEPWPGQEEAEGGRPQPHEPSREDPTQDQDTTDWAARQAWLTEDDLRWLDYLDDQQMYRELAHGLG